MGATLNIRKAILAVTLSVCLASLAGLNLLHAQGTTATILGTVTDTSGAAIAGAAVEVKNTGTGLSQNVTTDPQGRYRVPDLGSEIMRLRPRKVDSQRSLTRESR